ncbi:MAG TPA: hypothetical protein VGT79_04980 [Xanthomonadaceae bacterium]|nr:hypothetical protein [Xanthomonadaceae bacterium]
MFRAYNVFSLLRPARPRHPIVQALFALLATCAFVVLLVFGLAIAAIVMFVGAMVRAFAPSRPVDPVSNARSGAHTEAPAADGDVIDGEFHVVAKPLPQSTGN